MPKLDVMPVELLAQVAYFLANKISYRINNLKELLALRCASRSCKAPMPKFQQPGGKRRRADPLGQNRIDAADVCACDGGGS